VLGVEERVLKTDQEGGFDRGVRRRDILPFETICDRTIAH
jgi:hypothetical protein